MPHLLEIEDLGIRYDTREGEVVAVDSVSLTVEEGELVGLVGTSGSGKSNVLAACLQLVPAPGRIVSGSIRYCGDELIGAEEKAMQAVRGVEIGMVMQDPMTSLHPSMTVGAQLRRAVRAHAGVRGAELEERVIEALALADVPHPRERLRTYPHQLSGGLRQRVMIALALVNRPRLLLADEPTTALDVTVQAQILRLLRRLNDETGLTIVIVTHNLGIVAGLCRRTLVMQDGRIVEEAPTSTLFGNPTAERTRTLLRVIPRIDVPYEAHRQQPVGEPSVLASCREVSKHFKVSALAGGGAVHAVEDVTLDIRRGESLALVGESGSGKTTLARCLVGLTEPTSGTVTYDGVLVRCGDRAGLRALRRRVQLVFQDPYSSLNPRMTVHETLSEPLVFHGLARKGETTPRVHELLRRVQLEPRFADRYPHQMSGGERQRVGIARALSLEPQLIVADEPVSAVDVAIQSELIELFDQLRAELDVTLVTITHDLGVVRRLCDRVAVMYLGRLVEVADTAELFSHPRHPYTQALLRSVPVPDPVAARKAYDFVVPGERPSTLRPPDGCPFHPRCERALPQCREAVPPLEAWNAAGSLHACINPLPATDHVAAGKEHA